MLNYRLILKFERKFTTDYLKTLSVVYLCRFYWVSIGKQILNWILDTQQAATEFSTILVISCGELNSRILAIQNQFLFIAVVGLLVSMVFM
jgi:hypothetical protein